MDIAFIVLTYNRADALLCVLRALAAECRSGDCVVVADDGSSDDAVDRLRQQAPPMPCPLWHVWHPDAGFTAARARNLGVAASRGDYLVFLDGDCVPLPGFRDAHQRLARPGCFVNGSRVLLSERATHRVLSGELDPARLSLADWLRLRLRGDSNRLGHLLRGPSWPRRARAGFEWRGIRSCNFGLWRSDFEAVDGFDASFDGWGHEDADLVLRLHHLGLCRVDGWWATEVVHLWHAPQDRGQESPNRARVQGRIGGGQVRASIGLSQVDLHATYGGVVPEIASRAHAECLDGIVAAELADRLHDLARGAHGARDQHGPRHGVGGAADVLRAGLAAADACAQAGLVGPNAVAIIPDTSQSHGILDWRAFLTRTLERGEYQISYVSGVRDLVSDTLLMKESFTQVWDDSGQPIPIGVFVGMAEKFGAVIALDRGVTQLVVARLAELGADHAIVVNLSMLTLGSAEFRHWLGTVLREQSASAKQLILSVTAYSAARDPLLVREFAAFVRQHGARFLLKRYEPRFVPSETLKVLQPDAIRLARALTAGVAEDERKRALIGALLELGALLGIAVFAERVTRDPDLAVLRELGLAGASQS